MSHRLPLENTHARISVHTTGSCRLRPSSQESGVCSVRTHVVPEGSIRFHTTSQEQVPISCAHLSRMTSRGPCTVCGEDVLTSQPRTTDGEGNYSHDRCLVANGGIRTLRGQCRICGEGVYTDQGRSRDQFGIYMHDSCMEESESDMEDEEEEVDDGQAVVYRVLNGSPFEIVRTSSRRFQEWDASCKLRCFSGPPVWQLYVQQRRCSSRCPMLLCMHM